MVRVGVTGGIGSGKSTVSAMLASAGAELIDADAISRHLTDSGGAAIEPIVQQFGQALVTSAGALNRDAMRELVFSNPDAKVQLENIIHPLISKECAEQAERAKSAGKACVVFDVPLLVESGRWRQQLDWVLVIDCLEATQISRVMQRSSWTAEAVQKVIAVQASRAQRLAAADIVIYNEALSMAQLQAEVQPLLQRLKL